VANTLNLFRNGAVGFIDWLDGSCAMLVITHLIAKPTEEQDWRDKQGNS
jgi:hypothetical protein